LEFGVQWTATRGQRRDRSEFDVDKNVEEAGDQKLLADLGDRRPTKRFIVGILRYPQRTTLKRTGQVKRGNRSVPGAELGGIGAAEDRLADVPSHKTIPRGWLDRSVSVLVKTPVKSSSCPDESKLEMIFEKFDSVPPTTQTLTFGKQPRRRSRIHKRIREAADLGYSR
jgi:hypothetical protein